MFENPWILLLLPCLFFLLRPKKFFLRHAYTRSFSSSKSFRSYAKVFTWLGFGLIVLAASNFYVSLKESKKANLVHKYVLVNDASGSMTSSIEKQGIGHDIKAVLDGTDKFLQVLNNRDDGAKDYVGAIVFSDDAFIVSPLVDDPIFVKKKLYKINYNEPPLNGGTNIENAVWAAIRMILNHGSDNKDNYFELQRHFYGVGKLNLRDEVKEIITEKEKYSGSSLIIFTDGFFSGLDGDERWMSTLKLLEFCKYMGIRVYFLSVAQMPFQLRKYIKETGGSFAVLGQINEDALSKIYKDIAQSQAKEYITKEVTINKSYSDWLGIFGLILIVLGLITQNTLERNFTEV